MSNFSRVTDKANYFKVTNKTDKPEFVQSIEGWYVGGTLQTGVKFKQTKQFTAHLLQPDGSIVGVNHTGGQTKQFLRGNVLSDNLGNYVRITALPPEDFGNGPFEQLQYDLLPEPRPKPELNIKEVHYVDLDALKTGEASLHKKPMAANATAEDVQSMTGDSPAPKAAPVSEPSEPVTADDNPFA